LLVPLVAGLVAAAGLAGAAPPQPDSLRIPGAPASLGIVTPRAHAAVDPARITALAEPALLRALGEGKRQDFFILLDQRPDLSAAFGMPWRERGRYVFKTLRDTAERSQAKLREALTAQGAHIEPYWITNGILVRDGNLDTLTRAAGFDRVKRITTLPRIAPIEPQQTTPAGKAATGGIAENLRWIGADRAWSQGTTGNGVTVGVIDTGVLYTHEAIRQQYRGYRGGSVDNDYNWLDPDRHFGPPRYTNEHGTHVTGIIVGDNRADDPARRERIGVAPNAKWIGCLGLGNEVSQPEYMVECLQFMLAPTRIDGTQPDPDQRPEIVNNSWTIGGTCDGQGQSLYQDAIEAWIAAGVVPVFAAGNSQNCHLPNWPGLSTVAAPASLAASFAVGSSGNHNGRYASHSLWGPTAATGAGGPGLPDPRGYPQLKPQVVAPGVSIRSAFDADTPYLGMTGTSMSAPHVAGTFALMIEAGECLRGDYARLGTILMQTAKGVPYNSGGSPAPGPGNVPNYATGWGEIDVGAAVNAAANACGPQGFIRGRVTSGGQPVGSADVVVTDTTGTVVHALKTDLDGNYVRRVPELVTGGYGVRVGKYGFLPDTETGLLVRNGADTRHDVTLAPAPFHKITGRVTDAATGWPLHARLDIAGYVGVPVWSDPLTGVYAVRLPEGTPYRFDVTSDVPGYQPVSIDVPDPGVAVRDIAVPADPVACIAPGYRYAGQLLAEGFENANGAPPGWTTSSRGRGWRFGTNTDIGGPIFPIPAHGRFAGTNEEDDPDQNDASADFLILPPLDFTSVAAPVLRFTQSFPGTGSSSASVAGSRDGGATWMTLGKITASNSQPVWNEAVVSLVPLAGAADARVRFHADDGGQGGLLQAFGSPFAVDDVTVRSACSPPAQGSLVIGHVRDANTGVALDGALVTVNGGTPVRTFTSADPGVGKGFYAIHAAPGTANLVANRGTNPAGYHDATQALSISHGQTTTADLALSAGRLRTYPDTGPVVTVTLGQTATTTLTVRNSGTAPLHFGFEGEAVDEHFESGTFPPAGWTVVNHAQSPCIWKDNVSVDAFNHAGGEGTAAVVYTFPCQDDMRRTDTSLISPPFDLSGSGTASLLFMLSMVEGANAFPRLDADISLDDGATWQTAWSLTTHSPDMDYGSLVEIDLTPYVGASRARVRLHYTATPPWGWGMIDQLHVMNGLSAQREIDLAPEHGSLAAGQSRELTATFDASHITQPGTYHVRLRVAEDTPYEWPYDGSVKGTMHVVAPASYGVFAGLVRGLGACDAAPTPLPGATVRLRNARGGTAETKTDADGRFRYWLPAGDGPFTLTAQAAGHRDADARTLTLAAGAETAADLDLRAQLPCLLTDPVRLTANVAPGQSASLPFALVNGGAGGTTWTARAGGDPAEPVALPKWQTVSLVPEQNQWTGCVAFGHSGETLFMRVFPVNQLGTAEVLTVTGIEFATGQAISQTGSQTVHARLYALRGGPDLVMANLRLLREAPVTVADGELTRHRATFDVPMQVGPDTTLVAAIHVPDGEATQSLYLGGYSTAGETAEDYMYAPTCELDEPTPLSAIGPEFKLLNALIELSVIGSAPCHERATPVQWAAFSPASGNVGADAPVSLTAQLAAGTLANGAHQGSLCVTDSGGEPLAVPVTLNVGRPDRIFANGFE
jgi:subtilisin family serine protease